MISPIEGERLLQLAKSAVKSCFLENELKGFDDLKDRFREKQGVFVTLHKNTQLRGCIGFPEPIYPLFNAVIKAAKSAAFEDPRFPPVTADELNDIEFEISILTVPELINVQKPGEYLDLIEIGRDGLIIRSEYGSGLLLPQVPVEWKWDQAEFLVQICRKAGLPDNSWKDLTNRIFRFQAQIFSEGNAEKES